MFIIEKPYVSEFLADTIINHDWAVLDNEAVRQSGMEEGAFRLWSTEKAVNYYSMQEYPLIYANSENAISWVLENLPKSNLSDYIRLFKDKIIFREMLKSLYPDFYFREVEYSQLKTFEKKDIKYPVVIKPSVGFLSCGVHIVRNENEWQKLFNIIKQDVEQAKNLYPIEVVDSSKFIIEELIEGDEFAIDVYYDRNGKPVILNIFKHIFSDENDVSDRLYITSAEIIVNYMSKFAILAKNIGELKNIRNFPAHMEVRVTKDGDVIPIEVNPLRFAGWCTTDIAKYAWGINIYEYFNNQIRPNWNEILSDAGRKIYYFAMAEVPSTIKQNEISDFNYNALFANFSNLLEVRRINYKEHPLFAVMFGYAENEQELKRIVNLQMDNFITIQNNKQEEKV